MPKNGVILTSNGDLLKAGYTDFRFDGSFDGSTQTYVTNAPTRAKVFDDSGNTEFHRWTGSIWILVPKGVPFGDDELPYRVESFSGQLVDEVSYYKYFISSPTGFSGFSGLGRTDIVQYSGNRTLGFSATYYDTLGAELDASMFNSVMGQLFSGPSGFSGFSGLSGISGPSGASGLSGSSGTSGTSGHSGFSGSAGISGSSGTSGISGFSGASDDDDDSATLEAASAGRLSRTSASTIALGESGITSVIRDSTNSLDISWSGTLSADITSSGATGLDTGAESSDTWYAAHVIADTTGSNSPTAMFSLSSTSPTLPTGYDVFRRLGWVRNDGSSNFLKFEQVGNYGERYYTYDENLGTTQVLSGGTSTTWSTVDLSDFIPPTSRRADLRPIKNTLKDEGIEFRPPNFTVTNSMLMRKKHFSATLIGVNQEIQYKIVDDDEDSSDTLDLHVMGFIDEI